MRLFDCLLSDLRGMDHSGWTINDCGDKVSLSNELIKDEISSRDSSDLDTRVVVVGLKEEEEACSVSGENRGLIHSDMVSKVLEDEVIKQHKDVNDEKHLSSSSSSCVIDVNENLDGEWVCRICHLNSDQSLEATSTTVQIQRELIQLGCGCKDELGGAHSHCAEAWFKIKGNRYTKSPPPFYF